MISYFIKKYCWFGNKVKISAYGIFWTSRTQGKKKDGRWVNGTSWEKEAVCFSHLHLLLRSYKLCDNHCFLFVMFYSSRTRKSNGWKLWENSWWESSYSKSQDGTRWSARITHFRIWSLRSHGAGSALTLRRKTPHY